MWDVEEKEELSKMQTKENTVAGKGCMKSEEPV